MLHSLVMPLRKLTIRLNGDTFEAEGEFTVPEVIDAIRTWVNTKDDTPAAIDKVAADLNANSDRLEAAVRANTPPTEG